MAVGFPIFMIERLQRRFEVGSASHRILRFCATARPGQALPVRIQTQRAVAPPLHVLRFDLASTSEVHGIMDSLGT